MNKGSRGGRLNEECGDSGEIRIVIDDENNTDTVDANESIRYAIAGNASW